MAEAFEAQETIGYQGTDDDGKLPLCRWIKDERVALEISQEEMGRRLGMSTSGYRLYERCREPRPSRLRQIAHAMGHPEDYFLQGEGAVTPTELEQLRLDVRQIVREVIREELDATLTAISRRLGDSALSG